MENKTFDVNRRTVVRTAAWTAPAVAVAAGAPAFAATGAPNLSTSTINVAPTRANDGTVTVAANSITFNNTGGEVTGLDISVSLGGAGGASIAGVPTAAPLGSITKVLLAGQEYPQVTGLNTGNISFSVPFVTIAAGDSYDLTLPLAFVANQDKAVTATVTVTPSNGGTGTSFEPIQFPGLGVANISQSASSGSPTRSGNKVSVPVTNFRNDGTKQVEGVRVTIESSVGINRMQGVVGGFLRVDLADAGVTFENGFAPGAGQKKIIFRTAPSSTGQVQIPPNGGTKQSSAPQEWTLDANGPITFTTTVEPLISAPPVSSPVEGIGVQFQTITV